MASRVWDCGNEGPYLMTHNFMGFCKIVLNTVFSYGFHYESDP